MILLTLTNEAVVCSDESLSNLDMDFTIPIDYLIKRIYMGLEYITCWSIYCLAMTLIFNKTLQKKHSFIYAKMD